MICRKEPPDKKSNGDLTRSQIEELYKTKKPYYDLEERYGLR